jgi:hypothetical protein
MGLHLGVSAFAQDVLGSYLFFYDIIYIPHKSHFAHHFGFLSLVQMSLLWCLFIFRPPKHTQPWYGTVPWQRRQLNCGNTMKSL